MLKTSGTEKLPDWPRLMTPARAAGYCDMSLTAFGSRCPVAPSTSAMCAWIAMIGAISMSGSTGCEAQMPA